jgi:hypothetical protein
MHGSPIARGVVFAIALAGCRGKEDPAPPLELPASSQPPPAVDQARPGELAEGADEAFGLRVPRHMIVSARFPDSVFASGSIAFESVSNYVRDRVVAQHVDTGPAKTVFTGVTVKGAPERVVRIEVIADGLTTKLVVRDETKPPAKPGLSEEERWKELGLDPKGQPLDPTHLE